MTATLDFPMIVREQTQDELCVRTVIFENEYRLPDQFSSEDVIVDIGANIGSFAVACLFRGAGKVICVEPCPKNFRVLQRNLEGFGGRVKLIQAACWRSDMTGGILRLQDCGKGMTAMPRVGSMGKPVESVALDDILRRYAEVRLLKVDCEGSEYAVLATSQELDRVQEIAGELHLKLDITPDLKVKTPKSLRTFLRKQGFKMEIVPHSDAEYLSLFFARRT